VLDAFKSNWPEYLIEAWCLGTFMVAACFFGVLLFHPGSAFIILSLPLRNTLMGIAIGTTAVAIIRSPWGKRSGAHCNPAVTLAFLRLGKIKPHDAAFYVLFQFIGGLAGVLASYLVLGDRLADSAVNFVVTVPGPDGVAVAFIAELGISFLMMSMVLFTSNAVRLARFTPFFAGCLVATYISLESPISGMSMNPARTFASAAVGDHWASWWVYFVAPPMAMLGAAEFFVRTRGLKEVLCAKLDHSGLARCIFNCEYDMLVHRRDAETERLTSGTIEAA
jgi:aquaporin Z